jgi:hypothetical protein
VFRCPAGGSALARVFIKKRRAAPPKRLVQITNKRAKPGQKDRKKNAIDNFNRLTTGRQKPDNTRKEDKNDLPVSTRQRNQEAPK